MTIAISHPGKIGDLLYCLPTVRHIAKITGCKPDFWTSKLCEPAVSLLKAQSYINDVFVAEKYVPQHDGCGIQPWQLQPEKSYDKVYHMGFREYPQGRLVDYYPSIHGFTMVDTTIKYDFPEMKHIQPKSVIICPGRNQTLKGIFENIIKNLCRDNIVYQIGPKEELVNADWVNVYNFPDMNMLETLTELSGCRLFIGTLSANLVLANGFPDLKKVVLCEPERWCPRHDIHTANHHYIVPSSLGQVLSLCE